MGVAVDHCPNGSLILSDRPEYYDFFLDHSKNFLYCSFYDSDGSEDRYEIVFAVDYENSEKIYFHRLNYGRGREVITLSGNTAFTTDQGQDLVEGYDVQAGGLVREKDHSLLDFQFNHTLPMHKEFEDYGRLCRKNQVQASLRFYGPEKIEFKMVSETG